MIKMVEIEPGKLLSTPAPRKPVHLHMIAKVKIDWSRTSKVPLEPHHQVSKQTETEHILADLDKYIV